MKTPDENFQEQAALDALGLLGAIEQRELERLISEDSPSADEARSLRETAAALSFTTSAARPSEALRSRIMTSIARVPQDAGIASSVGRVTHVDFSRWLAWGAAAALALSTVGLAALQLRTASALSTERELAALASVERRQLSSALEAERILAGRQLESLRSAEALVASLEQQADIAQLKISTLASLLGDSPEAQAIAVWNPVQQRGVLTVSHLPALPPGKDYQLWVVDPAYPNPVDGGVFTVDSATGDARIEFRPNQPVNEVAKFAVSLERKGGVPKAEGPMVLLSL